MNTDSVFFVFFSILDELNFWRAAPCLWNVTEPSWVFTRMTSSKKQIARLPIDEGRSGGKCNSSLVSVFDLKIQQVLLSLDICFCGAGIHLETLLVNRRPRFLLPRFLHHRSKPADQVCVCVCVWAGWRLYLRARVYRWVLVTLSVTQTGSPLSAWLPLASQTLDPRAVEAPAVAAVGALSTSTPACV